MWKYLWTIPIFDFSYRVLLSFQSPGDAEPAKGAVSPNHRRDREVGDTDFETYFFVQTVFDGETFDKGFREVESVWRWRESTVDGHLIHWQVFVASSFKPCTTNLHGGELELWKWALNILKDGEIPCIPDEFLPEFCIRCVWRTLNWPSHANDFLVAMPMPKKEKRQETTNGLKDAGDTNLSIFQKDMSDDVRCVLTCYVRSSMKNALTNGWEGVRTAPFARRPGKIHGEAAFHALHYAIHHALLFILHLQNVKCLGTNLGRQTWIEPYETTELNPQPSKSQKTKDRRVVFGIDMVAVIRHFVWEHAIRHEARSTWPATEVIFSWCSRVTKDVFRRCGTCTDVIPQSDRTLKSKTKQRQLTVNLFHP